MDSINTPLHQLAQSIAPEGIPDLSDHISLEDPLRHQSRFIKKRAAQNILNAFHFAHGSGIALNLFVTIHLNDRLSSRCCTSFKEICTKYTRWLAYKRRIGATSSRPTYVYTHENPNNNPHVHWCIHIPSGLIKEFRIKLAKWVEAVQGKPECSTIEVINIRQSSYNKLARYIIKGLDPEYIEHFGLMDLYEHKGSQGVISGQRAGFSRSLGPIARNRANFSAMKYYRSQRGKRQYSLNTR